MLKIFTPSGEVCVIFTQACIHKFKMKTSELLLKLVQEIVPTWGLAQMSVGRLMTMLKAAVMYAGLKHPFQGRAKSARASLMLQVFSEQGFDCAGGLAEGVTLREALQMTQRYCLTPTRNQLRRVSVVSMELTAMHFIHRSADLTTCYVNVLNPEVFIMLGSD